MSSYASDTKMNTANLALVFGPTLTRAPPGADARTLHNDVPSINVLIQLCIEQNEYIFGQDGEEEGGLGLISPPPPPELDIHITEQPPEPHPLASPKIINQVEDVKEVVDINKNENEDVTPESVVEPEVENVEVKVEEEEILDEVIEEPISKKIEPVLQSTTQEDVSHDEEAIHIPVPEKPQSDADVVTDVVTDQETVPPPKEDIPPDVVPGNELTVEPPPQVFTSQTSNTSMNKDMNYLQQVLLEIDQNIDLMKSEQVEVPEEEEESKRGKEDEEDEDSDSDSEGNL